MLLSGSAVIFTFLSGWQETVFGYISYIFSAYATTALVVGFPQTIAEIKCFMQNNKAINRIRAFIYGNKYGNRYMTDVSYRMRVILYTSLSFNILYAALKLISGIYYASFWYGADAIFYLVLSMAHFFLLRHVRKYERNLAREYRQYRFCGYLLFALNATLIGVVFQIVNRGMGYQYPGLLIYAFATYAFIYITVAVVNFIKYRKYQNPVYSAQKMLILARALVAMFALQSAMFASFNDDESLEQLMNTITGGAICTIIFGMAVFMVVQANKRLKEL
jgi:energy-converting hydrogenase Eha subunit C